jgi:hypothetical protein
MIMNSHLYYFITAKVLINYITHVLIDFLIIMALQILQNLISAERAEDHHELILLFFRLF